MAVRDPGIEHPGLPVPVRPGRLPHVGRGGGEGGVGVAAALGRGGAGLGGEQTESELSTNIREAAQCPKKTPTRVFPLLKIALIQFTIKNL